MLRITFLWFPINAAKCCRVAFLISHQLGKLVQNYFFLISYQRRKMLENYFLVSYQRCKVLQNSFFQFLSTPQSAAEVFIFDFLPTLQNAEELRFRFLISAAKSCRVFYFGFYVLQNSFFLVLSTLQSAPELLLLDFLPTPQNAGELLFRFLINVAKC